MKTVRDACQLQPNALSIKLSDQIEQLDELITVEGDGAAFFEKTHITQGMQDLIGEGVARLAGASSQAIFHLKQAMGGGKTHLLVGFGLLAKHPGLRKTLHVLLRDRETLPVDADDQRALQLERIAGWGLHPLESAALSRRTPLTAIAPTVWQRRRSRAGLPSFSSSRPSSRSRHGSIRGNGC